MPSIIISVSLDKETAKIWEKIPRQERSVYVRDWLRKLDPVTGEKKPKTSDDMLKKLLAIEPSEAKSTKAQRYGRPTKTFSEMGTITGRASTTSLKLCAIQTSALTFFA